VAIDTAAHTFTIHFSTALAKATRAFLGAAGITE
jgi:hypothetical protein